MPFSLIEEEAEELKELLAAETETAKPAADGQKKFQFDNETSVTPNKEASSRRLLVELDGLARAELPWFAERFDYLAYVALYQPKELQRLPRLSGNGNGRFQIAGCTMDGRFQLAEPIPGVHYQAFVIGLQAISRAGLLSDGDLHYFQKQVQQFAEEMDGRVHFKPLHRFLKAAQPNHRHSFGVEHADCGRFVAPRIGKFRLRVAGRRQFCNAQQGRRPGICGGYAGWHGIYRGFAGAAVL